MAQRGILAYGAYLPFQRLDRKSISATLGSGGGKGTRTVASYDEDTTSLGVEAARRALRALPPDAPRPTALYFATTDPAYMEKTNAATVHAALGLDSSVVAYDFGGAVRSGIGALRAALERAEPTLVVLSDVRTGLPGGIDEAFNGDGAVAFVTAGAGPLVAELVAAAGATEELLDRWRLPGEPTARQWEERFGEAILVEPAQAALTDALKQAGIQPGELHAVAVFGTSPRASKKVAGALAGAGATVVDDLSGTRRLHRRRPRRAAAGFGARHRRARGGHRLAVAGRRRRRAGVPGHRRAGRRPAGSVAGRPDRRRRAAAPLPHVPDLAGPCCGGSRPAGPIPSGRRPPPRTGARRGSTASRPRGARPAAGGTCRPSGCAWSATPSTRWSSSAWPTCRARSPPTRSTGWRSRSTRRWWWRWSTSTAAAGSSAS